MKATCCRLFPATLLCKQQWLCGSRVSGAGAESRDSPSPGGRWRLRTCRPASLLEPRTSSPALIPPSPQEAADTGEVSAAAGPGLRPCGAEPPPRSPTRVLPALRREGEGPAALPRAYRGPAALPRGTSTGGRPVPGRAQAPRPAFHAASGRGRGCRGVPVAAPPPRRYFTAFPPFCPGQGVGCPRGDPPGTGREGGGSRRTPFPRRTVEKEPRGSLELHFAVAAGSPWSVPRRFRGKKKTH